MLIDAIKNHFNNDITSVVQLDMPTIEVSCDKLISVCKTLRDHPDFSFDTLLDVCGVDYADYGISHWQTAESTATGFSRGVDDTGKRKIIWEKPRFASVYHLLSVKKNHRVRIKEYMEAEPVVPSVMDIWKSADWFER